MEHAVEISGFAALFITAAGFALPKDRALQIINILGCALWATHFALMGEITAFLMLLLAIVMVGASVLGSARLTSAAWLLNLLLIPATAAMVLTGGASPADLLPVLGGFLINTGVARCRGLSMTITVGLGELLWGIAALSIGSVPAMIACAMNLSALLIREVARLRQRSNMPQRQGTDRSVVGLT